MTNAHGSVVLFDGVCNFCSGSVRFIAANDPRRRFSFASLQSPQAARALAASGRDPASFDSVVLVENGRIFERSDAALRIAAGLRSPWPLAAALLAVPQGARDAVYGFVAAKRYAVFGKRDVCALPDAALVDRFLV